MHLGFIFFFLIEDNSFVFSIPITPMGLHMVMSKFSIYVKERMKQWVALWVKLQTRGIRIVLGFPRFFCTGRFLLQNSAKKLSRNNFKNSSWDSFKSSYWRLSWILQVIDSDISSANLPEVSPRIYLIVFFLGNRKELLQRHIQKLLSFVFNLSKDFSEIPPQISPEIT